MARGKSHVTGKRIDNCLAKITDAKDLHAELQGIGADIRQLAYLLVLIQTQSIKRMDILHQRTIDKRRIDDGLRKIRRRHPHPESLNPQKRIKVLRSYMKQLARKTFYLNARNAYLNFQVNEKTERRYPTKKPRTLGLYICCLEAALRPYTQSPYRYIAALFNAFNLRPEAACSACLQFDKKVNTCKNLSNILNIDCHSTTRRALWQIADKTKKNYSPGLVERFMKDVISD